MQTLIIKGRLPDANTYINAERTNRFAASKMKKEWTEIVAGEARAQKLKPVDHILVIFYWHVKDKKRDKDNIIFGQKFCFDGLVKAKIIKNDGWNVVQGLSHYFYLLPRGEDKEFLKVELI